MNIFRDDGNNPLVALGMVIALGVVPVAAVLGVVGGAAWLGYSVISALVTGAAVSPLAAILGGGALILGQMSGFNGHIFGLIKDKFNKGKPAAEPKPPEPTTDTWKEMAKDLNAKHAFKNAQQNTAENTPAAAAPAVSAPAPKV